MNDSFRVPFEHMKMRILSNWRLSEEKSRFLKQNSYSTIIVHLSAPDTRNRHYQNHKIVAGCVLRFVARRQKFHFRTQRWQLSVHFYSAEKREGMFKLTTKGESPPRSTTTIPVNFFHSKWGDFWTAISSDCGKDSFVCTGKIHFGRVKVCRLVTKLLP